MCGGWSWRKLLALLGPEVREGNPRVEPGVDFRFAGLGFGFRVSGRESSYGASFAIPREELSLQCRTCALRCEDTMRVPASGAIRGRMRGVVLRLIMNPGAMGGQLTWHSSR